MRPDHVNSEESVVKAGEPLSVDAKLYLALGEKVILQSIDTGREYAKLMMTFSYGAIPVYLSLLGAFAQRKVAELAFSMQLALAIPIGVYIFSSVLFMLAFYPKHGDVNASIVESVKGFFGSTVDARRRANLWATVVFGVGTAASVAVLLVLMSTNSVPSQIGK